jgi:hypothetical protein
MEQLNSVSHKLAETLYKTASTGTPGAGAPAGDGGSQPHGDVVDAEYTVKN